VAFGNSENKSCSIKIRIGKEKDKINHFEANCSRRSKTNKQYSTN
jgi:hypothetical protein